MKTKNRQRRLST